MRREPRFASSISVATRIMSSVGLVWPPMLPTSALMALIVTGLDILPHLQTSSWGVVRGCTASVRRGAPPPPARGPPGSEDPEGVQGVPQAVAHVVHREDGEADHQPGEQGHVGGDVQVVLGVVEEAPPRRDVGGEPQAEEREGRFGDDGRAHGQSRRDDDGAQDVGRMWRRICAAGPTPTLRAASMNSFSLTERNPARTRRAVGIQFNPPITTTISQKMPSWGPTSLVRRSRNR